LLCAAAFSSCGYHVAGKADLVPKSITDLLPEAISHEFIARTRYQIVNDPEQADAVLRGTIVNFVQYPIVFDQATGRASGLQVNVIMQVSLVERTTGKVIFSRPNFEQHDRYEISVTNTNQYFEESGPALNRLSRDVARDLVSAILDNF
jgi:RNase P/RNase MRP subunit p29